jgi:hypothetical protein
MTKHLWRACGAMIFAAALGRSSSTLPVPVY